MKYSRLIFILFYLFFDSCANSTNVDTLPVDMLNVNSFTVSPDSSSMFGNIQVTIESSSLPFEGDEVTAFVGNSKIYDLYYEKGKLTGYIEGSKNPGVKDITVFVDDRSFVLKNAFTYTELKYPLFKNMFSVGASYTHGAVNMGLSWQGQLYSPFAQLARQVGAYFPQPLIVDHVASGPTLSDAKRSCKMSDLMNPQILRSWSALKFLKYEENKEVYYLSSFRIDPDLNPHNIGVGGATIQDTIEGAQHGRNHILAILENLNYNPYIGILMSMQDPPQGSPFDYAVSQQPTVIFSTDLIADDVLNFATSNGEPVTDEITTVEVIRAELDKMFKTMQEKNITAYIANMPDITIMPIFNLFRNSFYSSGFSEDVINKWWKNIQIISAKYSVTITSVANKYNNIHIVDFRNYLNKIKYSGNTEITLANGIKAKNGGIVIGNKVYKLDYIHGLVSFDAIHLTHTGYALIANMFIEQVNRDEGYNIPYINLEEVMKNDPLSPDMIESYGIDVSKCTDEFFTP